MCCVKGKILAYSRSQHTRMPLQTRTHTQLMMIRWVAAWPL